MIRTTAISRTAGNKLTYFWISDSSSLKVIDQEGNNTEEKSENFFSQEVNKHKSVPIKVVGDSAAIFGVSVDIYTCRYTICYSGKDSER